MVRTHLCFPLSFCALFSISLSLFLLLLCLSIYLGLGLVFVLVLLVTVHVCRRVHDHGHRGRQAAWRRGHDVITRCCIVGTCLTVLDVQACIVSARARAAAAGPARHTRDPRCHAGAHVTPVSGGACPISLSLFAYIRTSVSLSLYV